MPVISAVGHEVDFTIADFVADHARRLPRLRRKWSCLIKKELLEELRNIEQQLLNCTQNTLDRAKEIYRGLLKRLSDPGRRLRENQQRLTIYQWNCSSCPGLWIAYVG